MPIDTIHGPPGFDDRFDDLIRIAYRVAFRMLGSRPDAEEVAQEAVVRACLRWRKVAGHAEPWTARVAANLALDAVRRDRRRPASPVPDLQSLAVAPPADIMVPDRLDLVRLLEGLSRRQREVVVLRFIADLTETQVAAELGTTVGTVKQHARRALLALRAAGFADPNDPAGVDDAVPARVIEPGGI